MSSRELKTRARIFEADTSSFREQFNRSSFTFSHNLAGSPLFELPRLIELAESLTSKGGGKVAFQSGHIPVNQGWHSTPSRAPSVIEAIEGIQESGSWVLLKSVQHDPPYRALLERCLTEIEALTGVPLRQEITWSEAYIFIASPRSVTPYHIDHESNFLLQIRGNKEISVFDPDDRSVLTEEEIERYYVGDLSGAVYREENQCKARVYQLTPGMGVHHPIRAPHWVKNGDSYSVSFSVNFFMRAYDRQARVYQCNHYLRKLGIRPTAPGKSSLRDRLKIYTMNKLDNRHPENKSELLRSGVERLTSPALLVRQIMDRIKR
ncbi:MAG: cupin-like domain-containing protein [Acidobacteriota bacterium]|nr:cupin-like domain-containing protein [Acidobacteriota bacterium]